MIEAVTLESSSVKDILFNAIIPNVKPGIIALIVLSFAENWNMVEQPLILLDDQLKYPLSLTFLVALLCFVLYVFIYLIGKIKIEIVIEPSILPTRLINIDDFYHKLKNFAIKNNTQPVLVNVLYTSCHYAESCMNFFMIIFAWCSTALFDICKNHHVKNSMANLSDIRGEKVNTGLF